MTLADLEIGTEARIESVGGARAFRRRLLELGLVPGTSVTLVRQAPFGDPLELRARGSVLSIRRAEAETVHVSIP
ncbi:MAG: hypothetical protein B6A08_07360 [Sorangiineae bacterium NIC37A_2]|jgi:Fe2+ transport system protein FeoA|nr:MAG: hypothetical protein B6A08_07360 [Sorangiineae bacterium NIC37A_2]